MLKLTNITKDYQVADQKVQALKGINLRFRKNEFVSILGPSGCGKTTMLNIIGGLDKYTDGDLRINGRSTKEFNDRDWDVYRNHRIGFIFQSYNLIPHQTILGNVELALTIAGVSKTERTERAKKALDKVGLAGQYNKKPNQLSGGQCQRVAIARALVNEPEILLADEPTGALDTVTSVQIMDLIKEISKEKLVIMVTHNPDLAYKYSTRIIKLLDGNVQDDSDPYEVEETNTQVVEKNEEPEKEKAKMSFWTAFKLSAKNLHSKLKRTIMVMVAGSIGIIGVATVLAVSQGVNDYIDNMQDDMLSGNPLMITQTGIDYGTLMDSSSFSMKKEALEKGDWVNVNSIIEYLVSNEKALTELRYQNDLSKDYLDYLKSMPSEYYNDIVYNYGINLSNSVYSDYTYKDENNNTVTQKMSLTGITDTYTAILEATPYAEYSQYITALTTTLSQCVSNNDYIATQYDVLSGSLPQNKSDILIVLNGRNELSDLLLAQLGYFTQEEFYNMIFKQAPAEFSGQYDESLNRTKFEYEELLNKKFTWYPNDAIYTKSTTPGTGDFRYNYLESQITDSSKDKAITLNVCGIVKPKENLSYGMLKQGFLYQEDLAREIIKINRENVGKASESDFSKKAYTDGITSVSQEMELVPGSGVYTTVVASGIAYNLDYTYYNTDYTDDKTQKKYKEATKNNVLVGDANSGIGAAAMSYLMGSMGGGGTGGTKILQCNANGFGGTFMPSSISIYPIDFENKHLVTDYLDKWNSDDSLEITFNTYNDDFTEITGTKTVNTADTDHNSIKYTDNVELIINMINTMINIVTYALVAFTALSLVVSTVMVGIITYVSVVERVKEIGVIRALGGRKKDVSHLFNAETFIIGLASGIFGILVTGAICLFINFIIRVASNGTVTSMAHLTWTTTGVMIVVSVILTLISGLIPARSAAKKDPVVALRTE